MTDRELLAQLKKNYNNLYDITENGSELHCNGQLSIYLSHKLESIKAEVFLIFDEFYQSLDLSAIEIPKNKFRYVSSEIYSIRIDSDVSGDYEVIYYDGSVDYKTASDLNYCWYKDEEFLTEIINEKKDYEIQ